MQHLRVRKKTFLNKEIIVKLAIAKNAFFQFIGPDGTFLITNYYIETKFHTVCDKDLGSDALVKTSENN